MKLPSHSFVGEVNVPVTQERRRWRPARASEGARFREVKAVHLNFKINQCVRETLAVVTTAVSINRIDFGDAYCGAGEFGFPPIGGRARCGSHLDGVAILQCFGRTIDHLVLRR